MLLLVDYLVLIFFFGAAMAPQKAARRAAWTKALRAEAKWTLVAPRSAARMEDFGRPLDEGALLLRSQLDHAPVFVGIAEGGEDSAFDSEVRVVHVG